VTADLPRLSTFYRDVLGFVLCGAVQAISGDELPLLGLCGSGRRQVLRLGGQSVAIEQFDPPGRPYPADGNVASLSFQHLAMVTADMGQAFQRVRGQVAISQDGPQQLPASSGGVIAYKFRDPDGHPLELLQFPDNSPPQAWRGKSAIAGQIGLGIDHSAISVADADASVAFYGSLGLKPGERTLNHGPRQQRLDNLRDVQVTVTPMRASETTPHLELLGYRAPRGAAGPVSQANDIAATRIVWHGTRPALLRDPDGHLQQIAASGQDLPQ
jgi:catechol 2,3-dioxygenase-like lactoylglutathione lyase family enzyme